MGKLADRIFFGVQGPRGLGLARRSLCLACISLWENWQIEYVLVSRAHGGWVWGAVLCVWPLEVYGKTSRESISRCPRPTGVGSGAPFFVSGL